MSDDERKSVKKGKQSAHSKGERAGSDAGEREKHRNSQSKLKVKATREKRSKSDASKGSTGSRDSDHSKEEKKNRSSPALKKASAGSQLNLNDPEVLKRLAKQAQGKGATEGMDAILREVTRLRDKKGFEVLQQVPVFLHGKANRYVFEAQSSSVAADVVSFVKKRAGALAGKADLILYLIDIDGQEEEAVPSSDFVLDWVQDAPRQFALVVSDNMHGFGVPPIEYDSFTSQA